MSELKNIVEAALLVAGAPLTIDKLLSLFGEDSRPSREDVQAALDALAQDYEGRGIELKKIERGYRVQSREKYAPWLARLAEERPQRYSRALLETLAIIAYRQPVTRGEIEDIRGVAVSSEIIKTLLGREWIKQVGTRDVPGKPAIYGTTRGFLEHFNLSALSDLPPLAELRDLAKIAEELNLKLPIDEGAGPEDAADAQPSDDRDTAEETNSPDTEPQTAASLEDDGRDPDAQTRP